jgi:hypothetical protein
MPLHQVVRVKRQGRNNVIYRDAKGKTKAAFVRAVAPRPVAPVLSPPAGAITGGTLAAGTYYYRVSAVVGGVEGLACLEQSGVVASGVTGSVVLTVGAVAGATAYKFYGRTTGAEQLLVSQAGVTYTDTNAATPSGALPTMANATVTADPSYSNYAAQTGVPQGVALRGSAVRYFSRRSDPAGYPVGQRS